jgi:hypothetical protein
VITLLKGEVRPSGAIDLLIRPFRKGGVLVLENTPRVRVGTAVVMAVEAKSQ